MTSLATTTTRTLSRRSISHAHHRRNIGLEAAIDIPGFTRFLELFERLSIEQREIIMSRLRKSEVSTMADFEEISRLRSPQPAGSKDQ